MSRRVDKLKKNMNYKIPFHTPETSFRLISRNEPKEMYNPILRPYYHMKTKSNYYSGVQSGKGHDFSSNEY